MRNQLSAIQFKSPNVLAFVRYVVLGRGAF